MKKMLQNALRDFLREDFGLAAAQKALQSLKADGYYPPTARDIAVIKAVKRADGCAFTVLVEASAAVRQQKSFAGELTKRANEITTSAKAKMAKIAAFYQSIIDWFNEAKRARLAAISAAAEKKASVIATQAANAMARASEANEVADIFGVQPDLKVAAE